MEAALRYIEFQKECPSPFHVVDALKRRLLHAGFKKLDITQKWNLKKGTAFFVEHSAGKSLIAFRLGGKSPEESGFHLVGSHTDSPVLMLRSRPFVKTDGYLLLDTQLHGGLIQRSWIDRPLILAGRTYTSRSKDPIIESTLVQTSMPSAIIPDVAIHLDRDKNTQGAIQPETMLKALFGKALPDQEVTKKFASLLSVPVMDGFDLCLAPFWPHATVGFEQEFVCGPRHDDLAMVFCSLEGLLQQKDDLSKTSVSFFLDGEETGSSVSGGAHSAFVDDVLMRIHAFHPKSDGSTMMGRALAQSIFLSLDMAHGVHPNFPEKHDRWHRPIMNEGPVIKINANDRYATTGWGATYFRHLCREQNIPTQEFVIRQDLACGSTIGPIVASKLGCETIDVGLAMLGMHSACETMGADDLELMIKVCAAFAT